MISKEPKNQHIYHFSVDGYMRHFTVSVAPDDILIFTIKFYHVFFGKCVAGALKLEFVCLFQCICVDMFNKFYNKMLNTHSIFVELSMFCLKKNQLDKM